MRQVYIDWNNTKNWGVTPISSNKESTLGPNKRLPALSLLILCFLFFAAQSSFAAFSPPTTDLPQTGQNICYDGGNNPAACAGTGQDGEVLAGVQWPVPRFVLNAAPPDSGDTIADNLTGLVWTKNAVTPGTVACVGGAGCSGGFCTGGLRNWQQALDYVTCLNGANAYGHNDWRLPNVNELRGLGNGNETNVATWLNTQGFINTQSSMYWSSTTYAATKDMARTVYMVDVNVGSNTKTNSTYVWPVRGASTGPAPILRTGQTTCYDISGTLIGCGGTGQDGDKLSGVAWPGTRFTDNLNGTITDNLTGLIWLQKGDCSGQGTWQNALTFSDTLSSGSCNLSDSSVAGDWRLPNINELMSLVNFEETVMAAWLNSKFINVQSGLNNYYWAATTFAGTTSKAWYVTLNDGGSYYSTKATTATYYALPVRGGIYGNAGISVSPAAKDFGSVNPGGQSALQDFTVTNTGTNNLNIGTITVPSDFNIQSDGCSGTKVAPGMTCTLGGVYFSPSAAGVTNSNISIPSNAPGSPALVAVSGSGLQQYTLNVTRSGTGAGAISAGVNCTLIWVGNIGTCAINGGTAITMSGTAADTGSAFTGWTSGAGSAASCTGAGQCSFNLNANTSVTGSFSPTFSQYADIVTGFSSQWASTSWPATQALGAPDTNSYGDYSTAWAPLPKNGSQEYLMLEFASPVYASGAMVRETYGNGFVTQIDAIDLSDALHTVWSGTDNSAPGSPVNFEVSWTLTSYLVKGLKIYVDTDHNVNAWEEIDSVRLYGVAAAEVNPPAGGVSINGGSGYTPSASVTLTLTCTDAEGSCTDMRFRNENDGWSAPEPFSTTKAWTLSAGDGTKTVYAKVKDNAGGWGNWSGALSDTIILDTVQPTGKVSINSDAAYTSSATVSLKLSASDTNSMDMQFSNDNVNWSVFEPYATTKTWTLSAGDGAKTVYVKFRDSAGNMSGIYNDSINLDSTHTFQYASSVINYSSQYGTSSWSATQTLGEPNTFSYGDVSTSWTSSSQNGTQEYLTLGFTTPVYTDGVVIRETYGNGFVTKIDVLDTDDVLHTVWTGSDTSASGSPVNFDVSWTQTAYLVKGVKVYVDTDHSGAWEEMDSVQLKGVAASCPPPAGLVSWWKGEGNANDSTGTNNGALTNGNTYSTGKAGQAFSLDGTNDYVAIPKVVDRWAQGTIGVWVKYNNPAPGPNGTYIFSASSNVPLTGSWDGTNLGIHPSYGGNDLRFGIYTSGWQWAASGLVPVSGQWYHIVGTWGPAGIKIFINGDLKGTNAYNGASSFANYNIIGASSWPGTVVNGIVDEFQIYDRALDPSEIASLYNSVDTGTCAPALASDITPEAFTFTDQVGVAINTVMTSNTITVAGINAAAPISITGGTYSINGGSYTSAAGTANNGDQVAVRLTTSVNNSSTTNAMLTIGGVSDTFSVTTIPVPTYTITPGAGPNGKISCAPATVNHGSSSTCTITPDADYQVEDIEVDGVSVGKAATYSMSNITSDCTVTASFSIKKFNLSITETGSGTVAVSPPGGSCGTGCFTYNKNQRVTVTAKAEKESIFTGWSGACSGAGICTVTMGADTNIAANFVAAAPVISVAPDGPQDFETVRVGRLKTKTLKITNNGTGNLRITSVEIDGTDSDMFSKRSGTAIIKPGKSSNLRVMFKPKSPGLKTATLIISSNDPGHSVIEMQLTGTGKLK